MNTASAMGGSSIVTMRPTMTMLPGPVAGLAVALGAALLADGEGWIQWRSYASSGELARSAATSAATTSAPSGRGVHVALADSSVRQRGHANTIGLPQAV